MKKKAVSSLMAFALCGMLAGGVTLGVVHAEECSHGHEMEYVGTRGEGFSYDNPYTHDHFWTEIYWCPVCKESYDHYYEINEDHDMYWNDDMTALVCDCGFEDKW